MAQAYVKLELLTDESDSFTTYKQMRDTLKADRVEMVTAEQKKDKNGHAISQKKSKVTGYFWAEVLMSAPSLEEVASGQGNSEDID